MRLWHHELIQLLPKSQLTSQWRELNCIYENHTNHLLINYIYEYDDVELYLYSKLVMHEMSRRGYKVDRTRFNERFKELDKTNMVERIEKFLEDKIVFERHHNLRYFHQCFCNLQEKYDRGQRDFSEEVYKELFTFYVLKVDSEMKKKVVEMGDEEDNTQEC